MSEVDDRLELEKARQKLDEEHEGLEAVKKRVVEYLAVYRCAYPINRVAWADLNLG